MINYSSYSPGQTDERIGVVTFSNAGKSDTCVVTQQYVVPTRKVIVEPVSNMRVEHSSHPAAEGSIANFHFIGTENSLGEIYFNSGNIEVGTSNLYSKSGSIKFNDIETGATTVTLHISALDFGYNGHFYGVYGDFRQIDVQIGGSGTAITSGDAEITLNIPSGTTDYTYNLDCGGNPTMAYDY